jgi:anti-sigma B factor antagonist
MALAKILEFLHHALTQHERSGLLDTTFEMGVQFTQMDAQPSRIAIDAGVGQLTITGVVDSHTAPQLQEAIQAKGSGHDLHLDLAAVDFIDSSGLRIIVNAHSELEAAGSRLVLSRASDAVSRLLDITGLTDHLNIG